MLTLSGNLSSIITLAGGMSLATSVALNWNTMSDKLRPVITTITGLVGGSLLALGAILCFSGGGLPLGIGMMIAGGMSLATAVALNWDAIPEKIREVWKAIKNILNNMILQGVEDFINRIIDANNLLIKGINKILSLGDAVAKAFGLSSGLRIPTIPAVSIPRLAQGAVIPPNREFMAVLGDQKSGTNIEAPDGLIRKIMREELSNLNLSPQITVVASGNSAQLIRYLNFEIAKDNSRKGPNFVKVGATT